MEKCKLVKSFFNDWFYVCEDKKISNMTLEELMQVPVKPEPTWWEKFKEVFKDIPLLWRYRKGL